jgi:predicted RNase H-like HicB family nuclease
MHLIAVSRKFFWKAGWRRSEATFIYKEAGKYDIISCNDRSGGGMSMKKVKIIVEKHPDGYVAYPLGLKGVVVGQGDTYEDALADVKSAIRFHIETFGEEVLEVEPPIIEAFVAEAGV